MGQSSREKNQQRRQELLIRSHDLRLRIAQDAQALEHPLALADKVHSGFQWLATHPQWVVVAAIVPLLLRPRRAVGLVLKLWWGWRTWRRLRPLLPF